MPLSFKNVRDLCAYDLAVRWVNVHFRNVRIDSNAPPYIGSVLRESGKTGAKADKMVMHSLWFCRSNDECAGTLEPLYLLRSEQVAIRGIKDMYSRCYCLCGTTKYTNKESEEIVLILANCKRCALAT